MEINNPDEVVSVYTLQKEFKEKRGDKSIFSFDTKFPTLDMKIKGIRAGNFVILCGYNESGKTTLARTLTFNFEKQGIKCLWFSYEMPEEELVEAFEKYGGRIPEFFLPRKIRTTQDMKWIEQKMEEGIKNFQTKVVFIDSLDAMHPEYDDKQVVARINYIVASLKNFAVQNKIIIFLITHTIKQLFGEVPNKRDIRGSGKIADNADLIFFIWRKLEKQTKEEIRNEGIRETDETVIKIGKNRREGGKDFVVIKLVNGLYKELTQIYGEPKAEPTT